METLAVAFHFLPRDCLQKSIKLERELGVEVEVC